MPRLLHRAGQPWQDRRRPQFHLQLHPRGRVSWAFLENAASLQMGYCKWNPVWGRLKLIITVLFFFRVWFWSLCSVVLLSVCRQDLLRSSHNVTGVCDRSCFWTREPAAAPAGSQSDLKTGEHRTTAAGWCSVWRFCEAKSQHEGHHKCHIKATKKMPQKRKSSKHHVLVAMLVIFEGCKIYASWGQKKIHRWNLDFRHLDGRPPIQTGNLGLYHELGKVQLAYWFACIPALTMFWSLSFLSYFLVCCQGWTLSLSRRSFWDFKARSTFRAKIKRSWTCGSPTRPQHIAIHLAWYLW